MCVLINSERETMASKSDLVNLDAMIKRADFASVDSGEAMDIGQITTIAVRDFTPDGLMGPSLRKPDFQRETNHWGPAQVVSLLQCFVNGDLIPSVILWRSSTSIFVIDGGHRLSVLKAWVENDYGDGPTSQAFFGYEISNGQKKTASRTRELIAESIGTFQHFQAKLKDPNIDESAKVQLMNVVSRGLQIQWVRGDADKAENSFFQINTKGTPLDEIEELLLKSRLKPVSIAARAIIRAGKGHRYWSKFAGPVATQIEESAKKLHEVLFDPEVKTPIKTLDLPLGGPKSVRNALQVLIELMLVANNAQTSNGLQKDIDDLPIDVDGSLTTDVLKKTLALMKRLTGNEGGSLGLHPAVYFYGPTGRHSSPMFMGTVKLLAQKLADNDGEFFKKFTAVRANLETLLIENKDLIALILQRQISTKRVERYSNLLDQIIISLTSGGVVTEANLVAMAGLDGKIVTGNVEGVGKKFSDDSKSKVFIQTALSSSKKCPICNGYIDYEKSVSYDHVKRVRDGGSGTSTNLQLTHPYCNQSVKN